jgi:hypothetical protein
MLLRAKNFTRRKYRTSHQPSRPCLMWSEIPWYLDALIRASQPKTVLTRRGFVRPLIVAR